MSARFNNQNQSKFKLFLSGQLVGRKRQPVTNGNRPEKPNIVLLTSFVATFALLAGLGTAFMFPRQAETATPPLPQKPGSGEAKSKTKPERVKLAQAPTQTTVPGAAQIVQLPKVKRAETVVPRQTGENLNPYASPTPRLAPSKIKVAEKKLPAPVLPPKAVVPATVAPAPNDKLLGLTNDVVKKLELLKRQEVKNDPGKLVPATDDLRQAITALVNQAHSKGKSNAYVKALIDDALAGKNAVPTALANPDGKLDTRMLLASVIANKNTKNVGNSGSGYLAALESESKDITKSQNPSRKGARKVRKIRYVIVKRGDNLSKIAMRVYGDPLAYGKIFKANRKLLANANILTIGQRLRLPR